MSEPIEPINRDAKTMTDHGLAVGMLCMFWAQLDYTIVILIEKLLGLDEVTTACITSSARDTSQRCEIARRLVFLKAPNDDWRDCLTGLLNRVQNELASKRNRYVHDDWMIDNAELIQFERQVRILKPQSREALKLIHFTSRTASSGEIDDLTQLVTEMLVHIIMLGEGFAAWQRTGKQPVPNEQARLLSKSTHQDKNQPKAEACQPQP